MKQKAIESGSLNIRDADEKSAARAALKQRKRDLSNAKEIIRGNDRVQVGLTPISKSQLGLFATQNMPAFFEVSRDTPLVLCVMGKMEHHVCDWCHESSLDSYEVNAYMPASATKAIKWCVGCKAHGYCSKDCQKAAWKAYHKAECRMLQSPLCRSNSQPLENPQIRSLLRLLCMHKMGTLSDDDIARIYKLPNSAGAIAYTNRLFAGWDAESREKVNAILQFAIIVTQSSLSTTNAKDIMTNVSITFAKRYTVLTFYEIISHLLFLGDPFNPIVEGLCPSDALINASCQPNVVVYLAGRQTVTRTLKPVKAGEELTVQFSAIKPEEYIKAPNAGQKWDLIPEYECNCK